MTEITLSDIYNELVIQRDRIDRLCRLMEKTSNDNEKPVGRYNTDGTRAYPLLYPAKSFK